MFDFGRKNKVSEKNQTLAITNEHALSKTLRPAAASGNFFHLCICLKKKSSASYNSSSLFHLVMNETADMICGKTVNITFKMQQFVFEHVLTQPSL